MVETFWFQDKYLLFYKPHNHRPIFCIFLKNGFHRHGKEIFREDSGTERFLKKILRYVILYSIYYYFFLKPKPFFPFSIHKFEII